MGGQRAIRLGPGESYGWSWRLDFYDDLTAFAGARGELRPPLLSVDRLSAEAGESIEVRLAYGATTGAGSVFVGEPGVHHLWAERNDERSRVSVHVHPPLRTLVEARIRFALDNQRSAERPDLARAAFVPYDNRTGLTVLPGAWRDWNHGRERVGTALLLQQALRLGWGDAAVLGEALVATSSSSARR